MHKVFFNPFVWHVLTMGTILRREQFSIANMYKAAC